MNNFLIIKKIGSVGRITLSRPSALNALTPEMIQEITKTLKEWATNTEIKFVIIDSTTLKAFCSGGDLKLIYQSWLAASDHINYVSPFFAAEYQLNYLISTYSKPIISLVAGICMGGGMGLAMHSTYCVVTDGSILAMPETAIGLFPDVGSAYFLQNCTAGLGFFLGLSGWRLTASQACWSKLATHYVPTNQWEKLEKALLKADSPQNVLKQYASTPPEDTELAPHVKEINSCLLGNTISGALDAFQMSQTPICQEIYRKLVTCSPTSLLVWQYHYLQSKGMPLKEILKYDYRISQHFLHGHDFYEGIRAILITKSHTPHWKPNVLGGVDEDMVKAYYNLPNSGDLEI